MAKDSKKSTEGSTEPETSPAQKAGENGKERETAQSPEDDTSRDITLSDEEAESGSPEDVGTVGEEDPGAGLEFLVDDEENKQ